MYVFIFISAAKVVYFFQITKYFFVFFILLLKELLSPNNMQAIV